jgi:hypothetical protein
MRTLFPYTTLFRSPWALSLTGFFCNLLRTNNLCLAQFMTAVSHLHGGSALQPTNPMASSVVPKIRGMVRNMKLLHDVQGQRHLSVAGSTKDCAVPNICPGAHRSEGKFAGPAFANLGLDIEFFEVNAVCHI